MYVRVWGQYVHEGEVLADIGDASHNAWYVRDERRGTGGKGREKREEGREKRDEGQ